MKIGIMQPYFLPYIGYWQLMNAVDKYVLFDDVNYIKRGWINRNRILVNGDIQYIRVYLKEASQNKFINEISIIQEEDTKLKSMRKIEYAYKKAPFYEMIKPLIFDIIQYSEENLAKYLSYSIKTIASYLDIKTQLVVSSDLDKDMNVHGQEKIIEICKILEADEYYNPIGGREIYSFEKFQDAGLKLKFLKTGSIFYDHGNRAFVPDLSILDVLMYNSKETVKKMLGQYFLIEN